MTECIAPCGVFFDAKGTSGLAEDDYINAHFRWDFGDPNPLVKSWETSGASKNKGTGFIAAHVYEQAGFYQASVRVKDRNGQEGSAVLGQVEVVSADTAYAGATRCVRAGTSGTFSGCPAGAEQVTSMDFAQQLVWVQGSSNRRLLLRRGDGWASPGFDITREGPGMIGAFGSGSKPRIDFSSSLRNPVFQIFGSKWQLLDLDIVCARQIDRQFCTAMSGADQVASGLEIHDSGWVGLTVSADTPTAANQFVVSSLIHSNDYFSVVPGGINVAVMGSHFDQMRVFTSWLPEMQPLIGNFYITNNIVSASRPDPTTGIKWHSRLGVITDNRFIAGSTRLALAKEDYSTTDPYADVNSFINQGLGKVLVERNVFMPNSDPAYDRYCSAAVEIKHEQRITVRNNLFYNIPIAFASGLDLPYLTADVHFYNNTILKDRVAGVNGDVADFLYVFGSPRDVHIKNNLVAVPNTSFNCNGGNGCPIFVHTTESAVPGMQIDNNMYYKPNISMKFVVDGAWKSLSEWRTEFGRDQKSLVSDPQFQNVDPYGPAFLKPGPSSQAINAGAAVPVFEDYDGVLRPSGEVWDIGAHEY